MAVEFWGLVVRQEIEEIIEEEELSESSDSASEDDGYISTGEEKVEQEVVEEEIVWEKVIEDQVVEEFVEYPCHGMSGSSVCTNGVCFICLQPPTSPAYVKVCRTPHGVSLSYSFAIGQELQIGSWETCHNETWELPKVAEICPECHNTMDSAALIRIIEQEEWIEAFNSRLRFE